MLRLILGVLVWKGLISLKLAKQLIKNIDNKEVPLSIEEIVEEMKEAAKK